MKIRRLTPVVLVLAVMTSLVVDASPAFAAAPSNDDIAGAESIGPLPYHFEEGTNDATTSADEAAVQSSCAAPHTEHGVWFTATGTPEPIGVKVDATHSDYSVGIAVFSGSPGLLTFLGCAPGGFQATTGPAGTTFYMLVFGDGGFDGDQPTSGDLVLDIRELVAPPTVTVSVDPKATVTKQGVAHVTGTATCASDDGQGTLYGTYLHLRQLWGRVFIDGNAYAFIGAPCDGLPHPWATDVVGYNGIFGSGRATAVSTSYGCGIDFCSDSGPVQSTLKLSHAKKVHT